LSGVDKRHPQLEGVIQCGHFADKGGASDADVRTFWRKNFGFLKMYGMSARTRWGRASADILWTSGREINFSQFCADVFYGRAPFFLTCNRVLWI